jgi:UDPglucose 6-dehydrogenase
LSHLLETLENKVIAVLGLTYKSNTDTLRRSSAVELCCQLHEVGATVNAFDPMIKTLPTKLQAIINLKESVENALENADALVIMTEWRQFKDIQADQIVSLMRQPIVLDPNRFLRNTLETDFSISYYKVGKS